MVDGPEPGPEDQMPRKLLALNAQLKDENNTLESEKKKLEVRAKEQAERAELE